MGKIYNCTQCEKEFYRFDCFAIRNKTGNRFCSYECQWDYNRLRSTQAELKCPICQKNFSVRAYRVKQNIQITCSRTCKAVLLGGGSQIVYCEWCGEDFRRKNAEIKARNFCSRSCMGQWQSAHIRGGKSPTWKGGYEPYYGVDWKANRRNAKERDNQECQACYSESAIEVHHIEPIRSFANKNDANTLSNLITLCRDCHIKTDVYARWLFNLNGRQSQMTHSIQNDIAIQRVYFNPQTAPICLM